MGILVFHFFHNTCFYHWGILSNFYEQQYSEYVHSRSVSLKYFKITISNFNCVHDDNIRDFMAGQKRYNQKSQSSVKYFSSKMVTIFNICFICTGYFFTTPWKWVNPILTVVNTIWIPLIWKKTKVMKL